jgi:hypothetical protein
MNTANRLKYAEIVEKKLELCQLPYKQAMIAINDLENRLKKFNRWYYSYVRMISFPLSSIIEKRERLRMEVQVAITGLAVERFKLKYHRLPDTLEELVPAFLAEVPVDSFQPNNGKLKYLKKVSFEYDKPVEVKKPKPQKSSKPGLFSAFLNPSKTTEEKVEYPGYTVYSIAHNKTDNKGLLGYCKDKNYNHNYDIVWAVMKRKNK